MIDDIRKDSASSTTTSVSVFGTENGGEDFPVLKAFQKYIDAEQAKSRKRMINLSIFFVVLLVIVILTFVCILAAFINRNQSLSDRLLDLALRERGHEVAPVVNVQPSAVQGNQDAAMKGVLEKLDALTSAMSRAQQTPVVVAAPAAQPIQSVATPPAESAETLRLKAEFEKLQKELRAERIKREKEESERKHQEEVERHRRRLYPEYYQAQEKPAAEPREQSALPSAFTPPAPRVPPRVTKPAPQVKAPKIEAINYFDEDDDDAELEALLKRTPKPAAKVDAKPAANTKPAQKPTEKSAVKPAAKPAAKPATKAAAKPAAKAAKAKAVNVGTDDDALPMLLSE